MSAVPNFHTRAKAETMARAESAKDGAKRANDFLSELDQLLSEGFAEGLDVTQNV